MNIRHVNPRRLSPSKKEEISRLCHPIAVKAFGTPIAYQDVYSHITEPEILLLLYHGDEIVAFGSFAYMNRGIRILHLHGICVLPEHQGNGYFRKLVLFAKKKFRANILTARTQNPRLYKAIAGLTSSGNVFPSHRKNTPKQYKLIARHVVEHLKLKEKLYDPYRMTFKKVYGSYLYPSIPLSDDSEINIFFQRQLSVRKGSTKNAMMVISELDQK